MSDENPKVICVALRVRRTTHEDAYVSVPATDAIMKPMGDGTCRIDFEKFVAEAIRLSQDPRVEWEVEDISTESHPTQQPKPDDRQAFDVHRIQDET